MRARSPTRSCARSARATSSCCTTATRPRTTRPSDASIASSRPMPCVSSSRRSRHAVSPWGNSQPCSVCRRRCIDSPGTRFYKRGRRMLGERRGRSDSTLDSFAIDWASVTLPDAWPDRLRLAHPSDLARFLRRLFAPRRPVEIPATLPGVDGLPEYLRQEFHHLPNGNYSKRIVAGYARAFDALMLGRANRARRAIARRLAGCATVLDLGCGAGGLAGALVAAGVPEVWALDPSPYLLHEGARRHPRVRFVQGLAERTPF